MCQRPYSYLKRDESATNWLLINPIEVNSGHEFGAVINKVIEKLSELLTKCNTFRNTATAELFYF